MKIGDVVMVLSTTDEHPDYLGDNYIHTAEAREGPFVGVIVDYDEDRVWDWVLEYTQNHHEVFIFEDQVEVIGTVACPMCGLPPLKL